MTGQIFHRHLRVFTDTDWNVFLKFSVSHLVRAGWFLSERRCGHHPFSPPPALVVLIYESWTHHLANWYNTASYTQVWEILGISVLLAFSHVLTLCPAAPRTGFYIGVASAHACFNISNWKYWSMLVRTQKVLETVSAVLRGKAVEPSWLDLNPGSAAYQWAQ